MDVEQPQMFAKYMIPDNQDRYELGFGVVPLSDTVSATTSTTSTTTTTTTAPSIPDFTPDILDVSELPAHLAPFFAPKLIRVQKVVRVVQYRYDEQQKKFCWHVMSQPLREPSLVAKPAFRISCPSLDRKYDFESVFWFLRHYNIRKDGSYYRATPETIPDGKGFGEHGTFAPDTERKFIDFVEQHFKMILVLKLAFKQGFRWQPATFPVSPTPLDTPPVSVWANPKPVFPITTANEAPTGGNYEALGWTLPGPLGHSYTPVDETTPLPWTTAPVPSLELSKTKRPSTRSRAKATSSVSSKPKPTAPPQAVAPPRAVARRAAPPRAPFPRITVAPVVPTGVPGSSHRGTDMVSLLNNILYLINFYFQSMVTQAQLDFMDNPLSQIDHRLLNPDTFVRPTHRYPLRYPGDNFTVFTDSLGSRHVEGRDDHTFTNERIFGE